MPKKNTNRAEETIDDLAQIFEQSEKRIKEERQRLMGNSTLFPEPRLLHYHFTHTTLPEYCADPRNFAELQQVIHEGHEEQLILALYSRTLQDHPKATRCFDIKEIRLSRHILKSKQEGAAVFPLLVFSMPPPRAAKESFFACLGLMPRLEFYHNQEWRYFVLDGTINPEKTADTILHEYFFEPTVHKKGGFLPMVSCWPNLDGLLETLDYKWDDRFYIL